MIILKILLFHVLDRGLKEFYKTRSKKGWLSILSQKQEIRHAPQGSGRYFAKFGGQFKLNR